DARPDVMVLATLPEREDVLKTSANADPWSIEHMKEQAGYYPQYARNTLPLNRGVAGRTVRYSEIGYLASVHAYDWSWAPLFTYLNNSGALDLVVNNLNAPAAIYRNHARELNGNSYLTVVLRGAGANTAGIGAKVIVKQHGTTQLLEQMPTRGFQSSVDPRLHFGLGTSNKIDSLIVIWPDRRFQVLTHVAADRAIALSQQDATALTPSPQPLAPVF